jgi:hypothetical protein
MEKNVLRFRHNNAAVSVKILAERRHGNTSLTKKPGRTNRPGFKFGHIRSDQNLIM